MLAGRPFAGRTCGFGGTSRRRTPGGFALPIRGAARRPRRCPLRDRLFDLREVIQPGHLPFSQRLVFASRQFARQLDIRELELNDAADLEPLRLKQCTHGCATMGMRCLHAEPAIGAFAARRCNAFELRRLIIELHQPLQ
jgi:hypothetical protein